MALIKLNDDYIKRGVTLIDNSFITNYLPYAPDNAVKLYLYGLVAANMPSSDNTLESFSLALGIQTKEVIASYEYWQDLGLVRVVNTMPFEIEYLPCTSGNHRVKKYNPNKYEAFTKELQEIFKEQALTPNNFLSFIDIIDEYRITPDAIIMIAHYCVKLKGGKISLNYILTVAKAWAREGVLTARDVDTKLQEIELHSEKMREVFFALKSKKAPDLNDKQTYLKWVNSWGYEHDAVIDVAKTIKSGGMAKLDDTLDSLYRKGIFTPAEIKERGKYLEMARNTAFDVLKNLGQYYANIDPVIDVYITDWLQKGFDNAALTTLSKYCFLKGIKSLDGMAAIIDKFYKLGAITIEAINKEIDKAISIDLQIKSLLEILGSSRRVSESDRTFFSTWRNIWNFDIEIIRVACTMAANKTHPFAFINSVLSNWLKDGVDTISKAEALAAKPQEYAKPNKTVAQAHFKQEREYSKEELESIFNKDLSEFV